MDTRSMSPVGRVVGLWRYPVKSMAGERLTAVDVSWNGFAGDRRWAFVRESITHGFPWLTLRQRAQMAHYRPSFVDASQPDKSAAVVETPSGDTFDITDEALASELSADGARLIKQDRGTFDAFPLSLITTQTLANLGEKVGLRLDVRRFRPNLLIEAEGGADFPEDEWVGHVLRIGDLRMRVDKRDGRCVVVTIDPETCEKTPEILQKIVSDRDRCLGVYGSIVEPGQVREGDSLTLESGI